MIYCKYRKKYKLIRVWYLRTFQLINCPSLQIQYIANLILHGVLASASSVLFFSWDWITTVFPCVPSDLSRMQLQNMGSIYSGSPITAYCWTCVAELEFYYPQNMILTKNYKMNSRYFSYAISFIVIFVWIKLFWAELEVYYTFNTQKFIMWWLLSSFSL